MEANLQEERLFALWTNKMLLKKRQVLKVILHVAPALTVSDILKFQTCDLEKVGQGH